MQEAIGSFNGYFRSPEGNRDQFTLRQAGGQSDADFVARIQNFIQLLSENGWEPWYNDGGAVGETQKSGEAETSFEVESIKLAAGGEHPRWVVKGGNFLKYGVTCWPETLEAAGIADKLADDARLPRPTWTKRTARLKYEWSAPGTPAMLAARRAATPPQLKERGLVLDEASLWRHRACVGV